MKPIALQLYSVREQAEKDFVGVLKRVAAIGYQGVEPAGLFNLTPKEFRKIVEDLGLRIAASHGPWAKPDNLPEVVDTCKIMGLDLAATGFGPNDFKDLAAIKRTAVTVAGMAEKLAKHNLTLFLHNHYWEFAKVDGRIAYEIFAGLCPKATFELDVYWAANFGANNPAAEVAKFKQRTPLLHVKDGPLTKDSAMTAVGAGKLDIPACVKAADPKVLRWLIVELDSCATDMFEAVEQSYQYLVAKGLGYGTKKIKRG